jgi:hypothetical protein
VGCQNGVGALAFPAVPFLLVDNCQEPFDLGLFQGNTFATLIRARIADNAALKVILPYLATSEGQEVMAQMKQLHASRFPGM